MKNNEAEGVPGAYGYVDLLKELENRQAMAEVSHTKTRIKTTIEQPKKRVGHIPQNKSRHYKGNTTRGIIRE